MALTPPRVGYNRAIGTLPHPETADGAARPEEPPGPARNRRVPLAPRIRVAGVDFDAVTFDEAVDIVRRLARDGRRHHVVTGNVDHMMLLRTNAVFRKAYELASLRVADGAPIVGLSKLLGTPLPERVTGSDLFPKICAMAEREGLTVGFLGGREGAFELALPRFKADYPELVVAGSHCPPVGFEDAPVAAAAVVEAVKAMAPDLLFVCLGAPKQENWWAWHFLEVPPTVAIHVGASLDFFAGVVDRAPRWVQRAGLEWGYRLVKEPGRMWRRYLLRDARFLGVAVVEVARTRVSPRGRRPWDRTRP